MTGGATNPRPASYDPGERIRVTRDDKDILHVLHGAHEVARIKRLIGGGLKVEADGRAWRLAEQNLGWVATCAEGAPTAELRRRFLRAARLRVGDFETSVSRTEVQGVLSLRLDRSKARPVLEGEILAPVPTSDPHALVALAVAALVLDKDLEPRREVSGLNGDNRSAALRYGVGH